MAGLFVDTSGWGQLADLTQSFHLQAKMIYLSALQRRLRIVTTNYIIAELAALMINPLRIPRPITIGFIESLKTSP